MSSVNNKIYHNTNNNSLGENMIKKQICIDNQ